MKIYDIISRTSEKHRIGVNVTQYDDIAGGKKIEGLDYALLSSLIDVEVDELVQEDIDMNFRYRKLLQVS
ncbi:hypothetical protein [Alteromonas gracilis]|uniref:hypothetical protein n=1 Tax=Alteromonas gracilis TaxID=1479524 RepID=UPI0030CEC77E